ncbi:MAG: hypothetical protein SGI83_15080 [Bacteroidota bacterium]|nr:hypothetical protein [Bacteroidota bacterium]
MSRSFDHLNDEEKLKAENEFLKMKLMLENGAQFINIEKDSELSPVVENEFLNHIAEFEKQSENPKYITVFDKIENPTHFKPVADIPDAEIDEAWEKLSAYFEKYNLYLDVCSPKISNRELYRFATEELFQYEMNHMNIVGMRTGFIYDEFHPDLVYDNSRMVEQNLFRDIFSKSDLFYEIDYDKDDFVFNGKLYEDRKSFIEMINRFKSLFGEIEVVEHLTTSCEVNKDDCIIKGSYKAVAHNENGEMVFQGDFNVELIFNDMDYWYFKKIQINGFNPK